MTAKTILQQLHNRYLKAAKFIIHNAYVFNEESDFLFCNRSDYTHEIEIKVNKQDFKADFNKAKHDSIERLRKGDLYRVNRWETYNTTCDIAVKRLYVMRQKQNDIRYPVSSIHIEELKSSMLPNKFSFCVPEGLIDVGDLPYYAGLYYIYDNLQIKEIRVPKFIHRDKFDRWEYLALKYYHRLLRMDYFKP